MEGGQAGHLEAVSFPLVSGYLIIHHGEKGISCLFYEITPVPSYCFQATSQLIALAGQVPHGEDSAWESQ